MVYYISIAVAGGLLLVFLIILSRYFSLWLQAFFAGARVPVLTMVQMSLRKVDPAVIVKSKIMMTQAESAPIDIETIESHYLAGGNVHRVTLAMIAANRAGIDLLWDTATAIDLAGRDVFEAVQVSVNPKVINCPDPDAGQGDSLTGISMDGIQLKIRVRVTVRTNIVQLVGGATEATVIARVGQSIISAVGSCENYQQALSDPMVITRRVTEMGLDSQTAFSIVSIDIADIDVGENIGAKLQIDQAEAEIRIARADAEQRRAAAMATKQEMIAEVTECKSQLMLANADIPSALSGAIRTGKINSRKRKSRLRKSNPNRKKST